ncbi:MAG TPA: hypothetical protein VK633_03755 [Verrucomicrobiae bacterium]|nr:hypothetical protein [Verrucomicrobiae bacterium]
MTPVIFLGRCARKRGVHAAGMQATIFHNRNEAFTRADLLTLLTTLAAAFFMFTPGRAAARTSSESTRCLANQRQLSLAWSGYADDNDGTLVADYQDPHNTLGRPGWIRDSIDFTSRRENWDPSLTINESPLFPYVRGTHYIWRCPSDQSAVRADGRDRLRVRSYSMNSAFGRGSWLPAPPNKVFSKQSQISNPPMVFIFLDEHPDSINDGAFGVILAKTAAASAQILDFPANYHDGGASFSFADGHAEIHRWRGTQLRDLPITDGNGALQLNRPATGDAVRDMVWLSDHTTERR